MKKSLLAGAIFLTLFSASAEPEIKGSVADLAHFINEVPKTVTVTGEAQIRVPAHRAVVSLRVSTESKSLQEALHANQVVRGTLADYLKNQGIAADRVQASKFSSTPKYGMFSEKAKSYRVENIMRISVQDEKEFQAAAGAVDKWSEVQFAGVEFEYADQEQQQQDAIAKACDNASARKKIYEDKLGLQLTAARFSEAPVEQGPVEQRKPVSENYAAASDSLPGVGVASASPATPEDASFGEMVYTARVSVEYTVLPK